MVLSDFYLELFQAVGRGIVISIALIIPSAIFGVVIGIIAGGLRAFGKGFIRRIFDAYAALWRGTPLVVQLFVLYFGLPNIGIYLNPYSAAIIGFSLCSGAYQSEYQVSHTDSDPHMERMAVDAVEVATHA